MSHAFPGAHMYKVGESYLGKTTWAMDLMSPVREILHRGMTRLKRMEELRGLLAEWKGWN